MRPPFLNMKKTIKNRRNLNFFMVTADSYVAMADKVEYQIALMGMRNKCYSIYDDLRTEMHGYDYSIRIAIGKAIAANSDAIIAVGSRLTGEMMEYIKMPTMNGNVIYVDESMKSLLNAREDMKNYVLKPISVIEDDFEIAD